MSRALRLFNSALIKHTIPRNTQIVWLILLSNTKAGAEEESLVDFASPQAPGNPS